jgi:hypothetical protein
MKTFATLTINGGYVGLGKVVFRFGMWALAGASATAYAQGITAIAGGPFKNVPFIAQSSQFTAEFDAAPTDTDNAGVGFSDDATGTFTATSAFVRFNPSGKIDARNGAAFSAATAIPYLSGLTYHFRADVDVVSHVYSIAVRLPGKASNGFTVIGTNFVFRTTANTIINLDNLVVEVRSAKGKLSVNNLVVTALAPPVPNPDCTIVIPPNPLTARGLATPYRLKATKPDNGPCHQANSSQSAFVQAAIIDTDNGQISIYAPLVIDDETESAVPPVIPDLPTHYVAALWFGYNGNNLQQAEAVTGTLVSNNCVNGFANSLFTQFSYCNAVNFFAAANKAIANKQLVMPHPGTGVDGFTCPEVRSFTVVDQDQSDNVPTTYLLTTTGQFAQNTAANRAGLFGATPFGNPSDNRLVDILLDPALGCTPWKAPDLADSGNPVPALALNELQARSFAPTPAALIPLNDPMTEVNGKESLGKVNAYRRGVDQTEAATIADASGATYCTHFRAIHPTRLAEDKAFLAVRPSPFPNLANSLFTFMVQRENASYILLGCEALLGQPDRITAIKNAAGVVIDATIE